MVLEWTTRSGYVLTELVFFLLLCFVIFLTATVVLAVPLLHLRRNSSFFAILRPLFENVFTSAIAFSQKGGGTIRIVFLGNEQHEDTFFTGPVKRWCARVWVHIYFVLLCSMVMLWFATVFSDAVLYRKTGTCLDMDVRDDDARCFLLSTAEVPPEVGKIINEEAGEAVPCERVQQYLILQNSTYDLEVICYLSRLSPLPALGVAYGSMKAITFAMVSVLMAFLALSKKLNAPYRSLTFIVVMQGIQITVSLLITVAMVSAVSSIHVSSNMRNGALDYLRGERFYQTSVVTLGIFTIFITFGLFPWWAFKPLEPVGPIRLNQALQQFAANTAETSLEGEGYNRMGGSGGTEDLRDAIHNMILLHQFSIKYRKDHNE